MAATDQPYRSQKALDVVFGVSCGALLLSTVWMFWQDYSKGYKTVQRTFRDVEATVAEREMIDKIPDAALVKVKRDELRVARDDLEGKQRELTSEDRKLTAQRESADATYRGIKADLDAQMSYVIIADDEVSKASAASPRRAALVAHAERERGRLAEITKRLEEAKAKLDAIDLDIRTKLRAPLDPYEKAVAAKEEDLKKVTSSFDRFAKQAARTAWTRGDTFRALPIIDGFESPTKIKQIWLPDLTIDYSFKDVPRYDRCTTCHLGIDRAAFDRGTLAKLGDEAENNRLTGKVVEAKTMLEGRQRAGENLGFDPADLPGKPYANVGKLTLLVLCCVFVAAGVLGVLEWSLRLALRVTFWGVLLTLVSMLIVNWTSPRVPDVKTIKLDEAQITQYCAHPRMDLFVDSNSPHPMEKFGCTVCHAGQGSATDFTLASHTPNDHKQQHAWEHDHGWASSHYWDYPMLQKRFIESSCLKCHHQVTDLIRNGNKEEAPKLLRGYNLIRENGCFGCHEINGYKAGRSIGPDMRLETSPPMEWLSAAEQERLKADPANVPGTQRKVGPSLRRLAEKNSEEFTRRWVSDPRGFREDTRMPHFYHLSTNDKDYLAKEDKTNREKLLSYQPQEKYPATEIHALTHYLTYESQKHLKGEDTYRRSLLAGRDNVTELQRRLEAGVLPDREMKDLFDVSKRFGDLALLSMPTSNAAINAATAEQRQLQEALQETQKRVRDNPEDAAGKAQASATAGRLREVTARLEQLARPVPVADRVIDGEGNAVEMPKDAGDEANGRKLFTEKGCLACHSHQGTAKADKKAGVAAVASEANFGPELSRIADKLLLGQDAAKARRWLVQWLLNPNVYSPRTRMPVTHLSAAQANDVATWLLADKQKTGWPTAEARADVTSDPDALRALTRLHLSKAPGMTKSDVDRFVPLEGPVVGIDAARAKAMPRDMDERELVSAGGGVVSEERMRWYVGKRAVGRLGCFGCHDVPGFETAKPIGVGLNDWGKKDHDKIAYEDGESWVKEHFSIVAGRTTRRQIEDKVTALWAKGAKKASFGDKSIDEATAGVLESYLTGVTDVSAAVIGLANENADYGRLSDEFREAVRAARAEVKGPMTKAAQATFRTKLEEALGKKPDPTRLAIAVARAVLENGDKKEIERHERALLPSTQARILELEKLDKEKGLSGKEKAEYEELRPMQFFQANDGRSPFEESFYHALEHHHREGFLNLKLIEPRSYDYNRIKPWDDRLRMPQFRFARARRKGAEVARARPARDDVKGKADFDKDEKAWVAAEKKRADDLFEGRIDAEEAEAREAVMTFVLGLVADPIPTKYVHQPKQDKAAEVAGRQVLDKYNCGSCHQIRPGVYEFDRKDGIRSLEESVRQIAANPSSFDGDYHFTNTTAWTGQPQSGDRMQLFGYLDVASREVIDANLPTLKGTDLIQLTDALRFTGGDGAERNVPASLSVYLPRGKFRETPPYGGTWTDLMVNSGYLKDAKTGTGAPIQTPRGHLPPPLLREGERVQPDWLYRFLLNPGVIRPEGHMVLRMPKFNMSPDEAKALVNYFAATSRTTNPAMGVTYPYAQIDQKDKDFWRHADKDYRERLRQAVEGVAKEKERLDKEIKAAEKRVAAEKDETRKEAETKNLTLLKGRLAYTDTVAPLAKEQLAEADKRQSELEALRKEGDAKKIAAKEKELGYGGAGDLYGLRAYKLVTSTGAACVTCHSMGKVAHPAPQGPNLALAAERLRPEWMEHWIARPSRMMPYPPIMSANFLNKTNSLEWIEQKAFVGSPLQETRAVRDLLLDGPRFNELLSAMPPTLTPATPAPPPPKGGEKKQ